MDEPNVLSSQSSQSGSTGSCSVCHRDGIHIINKSGMLRKHGPRDNPCTGHNTAPVSVSLTPPSNIIQDSSLSVQHNLPVITTTITASSSSSSSTPQSTQQQLEHPKLSTTILKRIPKGSRAAASLVLEQLLKQVVQNVDSTTAWSRLLHFTTCLERPKRGGKNHNLTTLVNKQINAFSTNIFATTWTSDASNSSMKTSKPKKALNQDELAAKRASIKLEDGDVKGAIRTLSSNDSFAPRNQTTLAALKTLHPPAPPDRRNVPTSIIPALQVTPADVRVAIMSFPNGSAGGPDGLRPQHLKDLIAGCSDDASLLISITDFVNAMLQGRAPSSVQPTLFGGALSAFSKKTGGVRPIAVGYVWRRLAGKVACRHATSNYVHLLAPHQLGFGVPGGCEAAVHTARRYTQNLPADQVLVKIDFKNAFNCVRRDTILEAVALHIPELLPFATSAYSVASNLIFGENSLQSEEGIQQGDPLGPLFFCLAIKDLVGSLTTDLKIAYLDDITIGGEASVVADNFLTIESMAKDIGLSLNRGKCEIIGISQSSRSKFFDRGIILTEVPLEKADLLGAPILSSDKLNSALINKVDALSIIGTRLSLMPAHDALFLLKNCMSIPKLAYILRSSPCAGHPQLIRYDEEIRNILSTSLNIVISDQCWMQASLPVRWGGLGVRSAVSLAPSAFLASAASTDELQTKLLPSQLHSIPDLAIQSSLAVWHLNSDASSAVPVQPSSSKQRVWDDACCQVAVDALLNSADVTSKARLLAAGSPHSADWLNAIPLSSIGLKLDDSSVRIAAGLRLGSPLMFPHTCICGGTVEHNGLHGLVCRQSAGRHSRHNAVNEVIQRGFSQAGILSDREPVGLVAADGKRPDGVTLVPWSKGRSLAWDATCPDTFAASHISSTSQLAGAAANTAESSKKLKYNGLPQNVDFVPIGIETSGSWGEEGLNFVKQLGRRIATVTKDPRSGTFLLQRISLAIQRGNAICVLGTRRLNFTE